MVRVFAFALMLMSWLASCPPLGASNATDTDSPASGAAGTELKKEEDSKPTENPSEGRAFEKAIPTGKGTVRLEEVVVEAKKPLSAASSDEIRAQDYELRPHDTPQEILNNVPGLVVAQHQGGGKATQYLIR